MPSAHTLRASHAAKVRAVQVHFCVHYSRKGLLARTHQMNHHALVLTLHLPGPPLINTPQTWKNPSIAKLLILLSTLQMSNRILSGTQQARLALLKKAYKPAARLQKGSIEYENLARSGRKLTRLLDGIDHLRARLPVRDLGKALVAEHAQQSVMIENNPLSVTDAIRIVDRLQSGLEQVDLASTSSSELAKLVSTTAAGADATESATNEPRNHIIASQWIAQNAAAKAGTAGLCEAEVRDLAVVSVVNTDSEAAYDTWRTGSTTAGGNLAWGSRVPLGEYRNLPISVRSNRLRIFPYPQEHREKTLHPLILACQMTSYFVLVHPFPDGNGRTSRMVKQDYLARQGYVPVVSRDLKREDYLRMIDGAGEGKPEEFVTAVLEAQVVVLHQASTRLET
ncbi:hypothetical protein BDP55DRAFT_627220 [Colletotrichum godetiae]|uniref:Fido domain-containing protein n=1 Tax=Colletotrichum godetiae TaxID=1209918 RepID=A0AAJ0AXV6_9PEZI|nr:uncharacterized protein BDP55DRAFT_627220 [Colletotrichum godetiae]KAK1691577.1 hypothetical protein BDP55DRAFT_627220 [Colletotrichum godetiae]